MLPKLPKPTLPYSWKEYEAEFHLGNFHNYTNVKRNVFTWLRINLDLVVGSLLCKYRGHDIECESFAGPESGVEYFNCRRCGWGSKHIYY